ncbi:imm11 family protein [Xanthomonas campestris]|uniref:DUF1629 domain-containing protein n=1 Tax=Xanthomonas campestris pv. papavericola TaxID=487881 RepID=A0AAJ2X0U4_XANCA|nr:DUF1629 domain-containing protein [Xanthomonas campestris]MEC3887096.1 DUF1629 domain-containing protein [Xanthomonas campestris pv. papavericola]
MEITMNDEAAIPVTVASDSHLGEFFVLRPSFRGNGQSAGLKIANEELLLPPGMNTMDPPNGDPSQYPVRPHLAQVPGQQEMPRDFEKLAGIWIVSEALKQVFDAVDPEGFAFAACDFTLADGTQGPQCYLCSVTRWLDALDESESRVQIEIEHDYETGEDLNFYSVSGGASLVFKREVVGNAHIFRQSRLGTEAICDRVLFDALSAAQLSGPSLRDAADL